MKNPFQQGLSLQTVEEVLAYLPEDERKLVALLRSIIIECIPDYREKINYNVPFYSRFKQICFIWPSSIPWGGINEGVALGFAQGHLISNQQSLVDGERKFVRSLILPANQKPDLDLIRDLVIEATFIDEETKKSPGRNSPVTH